MIRLMDKILRADKLDLRLTPYHVLATSVEDGFVQFVESVPLRDVISVWGNIQVHIFMFLQLSFVIKGNVSILSTVDERTIRYRIGCDR